MKLRQEVEQDETKANHLKEKMDDDEQNIQVRYRPAGPFGGLAILRKNLLINSY